MYFAPPVRGVLRTAQDGVFRLRAGRGLFRRTAAGSAAASEMPALNCAFSLFTRKREKASKREESAGGFLQAAPVTPPKFGGLVRFDYPW
jgi:hypothetical protein